MPKSAAVPAALAEVKSIEGDSTAAQHHAREALKKNPDYRPAMVTIARDHYRKRRLDLALYSLKGILDGFGPENPARDVNNAEARLIRGLIHKEQNNRRGAIEEFQKALALRPDLVEARVQLAAYQLEAGNATEAAQLLEGALKYDREHVLAHLNLGDAYRLLGKSADAKKHLEYVQAKDPSLAQVHYNLGLLYLFASSIAGMTPKQQMDKAISELEKFKEMMPRSKGGPDDVDELITRAKTKKGVIEARRPLHPPAQAREHAADGRHHATGERRYQAAGWRHHGGSTKSLPPRRRSRLEAPNEGISHRVRLSGMGGFARLPRRFRSNRDRQRSRRHDQRGHDRRARTKADRRGRRQPHSAQAHARRASAAIHRSHRKRAEEPF
jgi:tetratricopeptide (TPR) repeat protein